MSTHLRRRHLGAGALAAAAVMLIPTTATALDAVDAETLAVLQPDNDVNGFRANLDAGEIGTKLIGLQADDGAVLRTYCVEIKVRLDYDHPEMQEVPWDSYPDPDSPFHENRDKIHWILQHSFPSTELGELGETVGADLSTEEAVTATQAAIWSFSDGAALSEDDPTPEGPATDADVWALYEYLTGDDNAGIGEQPEPELRLEPGSLSGEAGMLIGPFEVITTAETVDISSELPDGVELVDNEGAALPEQVVDGTQFSVDVPDDAEAGDGTIRLNAEAALNVGRLFIGADYENTPTQSLILAQSEKTALEVEGTVDWTARPTPTPTPTETPTQTPSPTPTPTETPTQTPTPTPDETPSESPSPSETPDEQLPDTGSSPSLLLATGLALLGAAALVLRRRFVGAGE